MRQTRIPIFGALGAALVATLTLAVSVTAQTPPAPPADPPQTPAKDSGAQKAPDAQTPPAKKDGKESPKAKREAKQKKEAEKKEAEKKAAEQKAKEASDAAAAQPAAGAADQSPEIQKLAKIASGAKFEDYVRLAAQRQKLFQKSSKLRMSMRGTQPTQSQIDELKSINEGIAKVNDSMDSYMTGKTFTQDELIAMDWIVQEQMRLYPLE